MNIRDYIPLNFALMSHPANWVVVTLMIAIAGLSLSLIFHNPGQSAANEG